MVPGFPAEGGNMNKVLVLLILFSCLAVPLMAADINSYKELIAAYDSAPCASVIQTSTGSGRNPSIPAP